MPFAHACTRHKIFFNDHATEHIIHAGQIHVTESSLRPRSSDCPESHEPRQPHAPGQATISATSTACHHHAAPENQCSICAHPPTGCLDPTQGRLDC
eukprot:365704-Chlamydomonas_euryale.AAC.2